MILPALLLSLSAAIQVPNTLPNVPLIRSVSTPTKPRLTGTLRKIGAYPGHTSGATITRLSDGKVFVYGQDPIMHGVQDQAGKPVVTLRNRLRVSRQFYQIDADFGALMWDPQQRAWKKIPPPPECAGAEYLQTATALPNGKILIAGGLCDPPNSGSTVSPYWQHVQLSLWNSKTEAWEHAPSLHDARIYHTATLMPDGSVLLIGGESDPALTPSGESVLASVEQYDGSTVRLLPPLHVARARHTATLLKNGNVLVVGGMDHEGRALDSVELWDASTQSWRELPAMHRARYGHTATLLDDGRVLVAGGIGPQGHAMDSVELWDPTASRWFVGAPLPRPMHNQGAVRLANGDVLLAGGESKLRLPSMDWTVLWDKSTGTWRAAGKAASTAQMVHPPTMVPLNHGGALIFVGRRILQWQPLTGSSVSSRPTWRGKPALVALTNGRLMTIGDTGHATWTAHTWNPRDDTWTAAGTLGHAFRGDSRAIELPTRQVLLVGQGKHNDAFCEISDVDHLHWRDCGHLTFKQRVASPVGLGMLSDGRVALVANTGEAFLFDVQTFRWHPTSIEWDTKDLAYGAPVRIDHPLARLRDQQHQKWLDVTAEASEYLDARVRDYQSDASNSSRPALLWNATKHQFAYMLPRYAMGHQAQLLSDGCAFSWHHFSLFNPDTGKVLRLPDPGVGVDTFAGSMIALADGTVVFAGKPNDGMGPGFFHRKVSCAGFAASPADRMLMPSVLEGRTAAKPHPLPPPDVPHRHPQPHSSGSSWWDYVRGNPWPLWAVVGVFLLYVSLRYLILPLMRSTARRTIPQSSMTRLTRELPRPWALGTRIVIYGLLALLCSIALLRYRNFRQAQNTFACDSNASACLNPHTAILHSIPKLENASSDHPQPTIPCRFVGVWSLRQGSSPMFRINLYGDGTYYELPSASGVGNPAGYRGYWMVQGNAMVWVDKASPERGPDINPIIEQSHHRFVLIEHNGRHTTFEMIHSLPMKRCNKDSE